MNNDDLFDDSPLEDDDYIDSFNDEELGIDYHSLKKLPSQTEPLEDNHEEKSQLETIHKKLPVKFKHKYKIYSMLITKDNGKRYLLS